VRAANRSIEYRAENPLQGREGLDRGSYALPETTVKRDNEKRPPFAPVVTPGKPSAYQRNAGRFHSIESFSNPANPRVAGRAGAVARTSHHAAREALHISILRKHGGAIGLF
jgi:hypothetical protein